MRVRDAVLNTVLFIGYKEGDDIKFVGTGFIVGYPSDLIENWNYTYIVTARHVAIHLGDREFIIRGNTKDKKSTDFTGKPSVWHNHPTDESVDVAIAKIDFGEIHDYQWIGTDMFVNDEIIKNENIGIGDDVFFPGLFTLLKSEKNLPIMRMGNIAMMNPGRLIPTKSFGNIEAHLVESRSIGGLSGSPVFVLNSDLINRQQNLLGLMHGHWDVPENQVQAAEDSKSISILNKVNMGIAMVVPAEKILETLNHPTLAARRAELDQDELKAGKANKTKV